MTTIETQAAANTAPSGKRLFTLAGRYGTFAAFLALILFNVVFTPNFLSLQTLNVNLTQVATIVIVATGMTLVIATGGIDLSVGSLMAIAGALAPMIFMGTLFPISNMPIAVALALVLPVAVTGLFGLFNGFLVTRFRNSADHRDPRALYRRPRHRPGDDQWQPAGFQERSISSSSALGRIAGIPAQVILMAACAAIAWAVIRYTVFGRQIIAVGGNEKAARLTGIPVHRVKLLVYMISGALAGLAGLIVVARNSASDANLVGLGMELDAIAAVAVGGTLLTGGRANIIGTVIGAFVIQLVRYTLLANGVPDAAALIVKAASDRACGVHPAARWQVVKENRR